MHADVTSNTCSDFPSSYPPFVNPAPQERRTYFVTTGTANRRRIFQVEQNAKLLLDVLLGYRDQGRFLLHAFVIMPDHVHLLLTPAADVSLEKAVQFVKGGFAFRMKNRRPIWSCGFNEVQVLDHAKFKAFKKYIAENPVRAGLSQSAEEYPLSSSALPQSIDPAPAQMSGLGHSS